MAISETEVVTYRPEGDAFDVQAAASRLLTAVFSHKMVIVLCCTLTLGLVVLYKVMFPPVFIAEVLVTAEPIDDDTRNRYYAVWNLFRKEELSSEVELITAGPVLRRVVRELDLGFDDVYHTHLTQIAYIWQESWIGKNYRAFKDWLLPPETSPFMPTPEQIEIARTVDAFKDGVALSSVGDSHVGKLTVKAPSFRVAEIANTLMRVYLDERRQRFVDEAEEAYRSLSMEAERARGKLDAVEDEISAFSSQNTLILEYEKDKFMLAKWIDLKAEIVTLEASIASFEASLAVVEAHLAEEVRETIGSQTIQEDDVRETIRGRALEVETRLQQMRQRYRPGSREVRELEELLADTQAQLANLPPTAEQSRTVVRSSTFESLNMQRKELLAKLPAARSALAVKAGAHDQIQAQLERLPMVSRKAQDLERRRGIEQARYKLLNERLMMADVSRSTARSAPSSIKIVETASPPSKASWPDMKLLVAAALGLGLIGGVALSVLIDLFTGRVTRARLSGSDGMPVYATVDLLHGGEEFGVQKLIAPERPAARNGDGD